MRPELEIWVVEKDTFREVINDIIDTEHRLTVNSALLRNRNTDYLETEESTNNKLKKQFLIINNKICYILTNKDIIILMVEEVIIIILQETITIIFRITIF